MEKKIAKEGRKVRYTKMVLRDSLIELMRKKPFIQISLKEICALADIGRTTFYAHYSDQNDLLKSIQDETFNQFVAMAEQQPAKEFSQRILTSRGEKLLNYIAENKDSIQVLLSENGDINFQKKFISYLIDNGKQMIKYINKDIVDEKIERTYSVFFINGSVAIIQDWLKNGMDIPISEMIKIVFRLLNGVYR